MKFGSSSKLIIYTFGDPAGIGPEIILKSLLSKPYLLKKAFHFVIGDYEILEQLCSQYHLDQGLVNCVTAVEYLKMGKLNFLDLQNARGIRSGKPKASSGKASLEYLDVALRIIKRINGATLITAPLSKYYVAKYYPGFRGHTEYLAQKFKVKKYAMLFIASSLSLLLITRHVPLKKVPFLIDEERIREAILLALDFLRNKLKIKQPYIAVSGLNPHAGEGGTIGREEIEIIEPAIRKIKYKKIYGPLAADTIMRTERRYDLIVSMYHDQILPLFKTRYRKLVNCTLGLPFLRLSPDHGTAFDIAGKGIANLTSMQYAIQLALSL